MPELTHVTRSDPVDDIITALETDGCVIVDDFIAPETAGALVVDFVADLDAIGWGNTEEPGGDAVDAFFGYRTKRLHGLIGRSPTFESVLTDEFALACADRLLGDLSKGVILSTNELMAIGPDEVQQTFHRDGDTWHRVPRPHPELLVSFNVALTDFTADNGATVVVPGSHRWDRGREPEPNEVAHAVMRKGAALLYVGDVLHGGGANRTDETRIGMYFGFIQ